MSISAQKQIKDNSTDVREYFSDLWNWTADKEKEEKRRPVRAAAKKGETSLAEAHSKNLTSVEQKSDSKKDETSFKGRFKEEGGFKEAKDGTMDNGGEDAIERDKLPMPQYYNNWDQYDVDGEIDKLDDEACERNQAEREAKQLERDKILDQLAIRGDGERIRTTKAKPRVKISVRTSGRRASPLDLALPKKEEANRYFADGRYREAMQLYSAGLDLLEKYEPPERKRETGEEEAEATQDNRKTGDSAGDESQAFALKVTLLANRAAVLCKLEEWREAAEDTTEALRFDPDHHKSLLRRGTAFARMKRWGHAAKDLERVVAVDPTDAKAQRDLKTAKRMLVDQLKESRESAKLAMCDPGRDSVMPTRRLKVRSSVPTPSTVSARVNMDEDLVDQLGHTPKSVVEATDNGASASSAPAPAKERQPYVPRSVRMRGGGRQAVSAPSGYQEGSGEARAVSSTASSSAPQMNFYTFEAQWTRLRKDQSGRAALLRRMGARGLPALFRESLDAELVASIISVLKFELSDNTDAAGFAFDTMEALARTPRFELSLSVLSSTERQICVDVLDTLNDERSQRNPDRYAALCEAYRPPASMKGSLDDLDEDDEDDVPQSAEQAKALTRETASDESRGKTLDDESVSASRNDTCGDGSADFSLDGCD